MKVLVSDQLGDIGVKMFQEETGIDVDVKTGLSPEDLKKIIGAYDALVIRSATKVTADLISEAKNLKVVGRAGIGLDNVDIPAATKRGIIVMNTPTGNVITTAEHAISMMMALSRNIPRGTSSLKSGRWDKKLLQGREVFNKILGVVGYGKIGSIVADRARGLKMRVVVFDPYIPPEQIQKDGFESVSLSELYQKADYITVHVPRIKETMGLIDKDAFAQMKDGVMIINCARGGIINEDDLDDAIASGKVAGAALDVFETEPPGTCSLLRHDNVICTPHLGASTKEAQTNVAVAVAGQIIDYLKTGTVSNAVNVPSVAGELLGRIGPYLDLGESIGKMIANLSAGAASSLTIEYAGDFQGMDLTPVTTRVVKGFLTPLAGGVVNDVNAKVLAKEHGIQVSDSMAGDAGDYVSLLTVKTEAAEGPCQISGTIFGKKRPMIVNIDGIELTLAPKGYLVYIQSADKPGSGERTTTLLAEKGIHISQMNLGGCGEGDACILVLTTDTPISSAVLSEVEASSDVERIVSMAL